MHDSDLRLTTHVADGVTVVHVAGELDLSTVSALAAELERALPAERLVIELGECTFIDSSALRALVQAQKHVVASGGALALVAPAQPARRVLEIAALDRVLPVHDTVGDAVTSFR